jgi:hypothetical protein
MRILHKITLSNGEVLGVKEDPDGQSLHIVDIEHDELRTYICTISASGVLVMPNSCDAGECLCLGLKHVEEQPEAPDQRGDSPCEGTYLRSE